jgi:murein DD-endopeptidase MepM/ murein hydrolase activator NlpD
LVSIEPGQPVPGSSMTVRIEADGIEQVRVKFLGRQFSLFRQDNEWKTVIGIPLETAPGEKTLVIGLQKNGGGREEIKNEITVTDKKYPTVSFWLKPAKKKLLLARDLTADEWSRIENKLLQEDPVQGWSGKFALPVSGEVSMVFGTIERVNKMKRGQHRGMDIAVPTGTEVEAANSGRMVFAEKLKVFGGTMVIDHGLGVHSLYFHLSKFIAKPGDKVLRGQKIALSGNTGASSGPHLHWGMSVHDLRVDPRQWTVQEM